MKDADWTVLTDYVGSIRDELGLRDWFLVVKHDPPDDRAALASVVPLEGRRYALIRVCLEFRELTDDEQRHVIVHELLHCHWAEAQHFLHNVLRKALGDGCDPIIEGHRLKVEHAVDAISSGWAEHFPLIEWTTADPARDEMSSSPYEGPVDAGMVS